MNRAYTLPFGVCPTVPHGLRPYLFLEVENNGLAHAVRVNRIAHEEVRRGEIGVTCVEVAVRFQEQETIVSVGLSLWDRREEYPKAKTVRGQWSVQRRVTIETPRHCCQDYMQGKIPVCEMPEAIDCVRRS